MGDNVMGSYRAKGLPKEEIWAETSGLGILRLAVQWVPYESGEFEWVRGQLTRSGYHFIVRCISESPMFREIGLIWGIPV